MVDKKPLLVVFGFAVNPEFVFRNIRIPVMLAEIGELFVDMSANIGAIDNPYLQIVPLLNFFNIRRL